MSSPVPWSRSGAGWRCGSPPETAEAAAEAFTRDANAVAADIPSIRAVRRAALQQWRTLPAPMIVEAAAILIRQRSYRWAAWELVRCHRAAFASLNDDSVEALAQGLDSWDSVDAFARSLSGPAWAHGLVSDALIDSWSRSPDRWFRRAALVSTIALNRPAEGGKGDTVRTLALCGRLARDRDDMVEKALSWVLRELSKSDPGAVATFLAEKEGRLGARVKREVRNKLRTGLKNPRPGRKSR